MSLILLFLLPGFGLCTSVVDSESFGGFQRLHPSDTAHLSSEILRLLDLGPDMPPRHPHRNGRFPPREDAPALTSFMEDVYKELGGEEAEVMATAGHDERRGPALHLKTGRGPSQLQARYNVSRWLEDSLHEADLIASVPPDDSLNLPPSQRSQRLLFRFDHLRGDLSVISAELRLFRSHFAFAGESMTFILQRLMQRGGSVTVAEQVVSRLAPGQTGWLELNVTSFARNWMARPEENVGLKLELLSARGYPLPPDLLGFETAPHLPLSPFLVVSFRESAHKTHRVRRSIQPPPRSRRQKRDAWKQASSYVKRNCARRELRVDFKDLQWDQWVIAPRIYSAYYCGGDCPIPLHPAWNSTNHSIVQTLLSLHSQQRTNRARRPAVPPPCCVPIALQSMKMLYFDRDKRVMLRTYHDMKVKACGCH